MVLGNAITSRIELLPVINITKRSKPNANRSVYLLPAATQFETVGSCTASNRSLQWREKVIDPLFESMPDHVIMQAFADRLGFGTELSKNFKIRVTSNTTIQLLSIRVV